MKPEHQQLAKLLLARSQPDNNGCRLWTSTLDHGYGTVRYLGKQSRAHRLSYMCFVADIPTDLYVLHRCDVRNCIEPEHLFLGTHEDNIRDMINKGRNKQPASKGSLNGKAKLTEIQVLNIKSRLKGSDSLWRIAKDYKVSIRAIKDIYAGKNWGHVK